MHTKSSSWRELPGLEAVDDSGAFFSSPFTIFVASALPAILDINSVLESRSLYATPAWANISFNWGTLSCFLGGIWKQDQTQRMIVTILLPLWDIPTDNLELGVQTLKGVERNVQVWLLWPSVTARNAATCFVVLCKSILNWILSDLTHNIHNSYKTKLSSKIFGD